MNRDTMLAPECPATKRNEEGAGAAIARFARETRGGATAIAAAAVTVMTVFGAALIIDHVWLVHQRDLLKLATDSAAVAATLELQKLPRSLSDADAAARLQPTADRYVRFILGENLRGDLRERVLTSLDVKVEVERARGFLEVLADTELGETLLAHRFMGYSGPQHLAANSGAEGSLGATEIVLAIDTTNSMSRALDGSNHGASRMSIVKEAAVNLVDVLASFPNSTVAVGIVPWTWRVRLDQTTRRRWERRGWAVYPNEREYSHPTKGPPGSDQFMPIRQALPVQRRLPQACRAWMGCPDLRLEDGRPSFSTALPSVEPLVMNFYTDHTTYPEDQYVSYQCQGYTRSESSGQGGEEPLCYDLDSAPAGQNLCRDGDIQDDGPWRVQPQDNCQGLTPAMPLSADLDEVRNAIGKLNAGGSATYSSAGVAWGIRMLDATWRDAWGDPVHPMDETTGVQKVLVLLTDGDDNSRSNASRHRDEGCTAAKNAGILVFTIAAMHPNEMGSALTNQLRRCSSESEDPDGSYVFVNNPTPEALREAFAEIVSQVVELRRTH